MVTKGMLVLCSLRGCLISILLADFRRNDFLFSFSVLGLFIAPHTSSMRVGRLFLLVPCSIHLIILKLISISIQFLSQGLRLN
jgi:hypothetical protein